MNTKTAPKKNLYPYLKNNRGHTALEITVVIGIISVLSSIILVSFAGLNEGPSLRRASRELALAIRRAQNMSIAATQLTVGGLPIVPPAVGIQLNTASPTTYRIFGETTLDNKYTGSSEDVETLAFPRNINIQSLQVYASEGASPISYALVHIIFSAPEGGMSLKDSGGLDIGLRLDIRLRSPNGQTKTITLRTTGQVSIQ